MEFSRQGDWSELPSPTPGDLPGPGIEPVFLVSPAWAGGFCTTVLPGKPLVRERSEFSQPSAFIHLFIHPFIHSPNKVNTGCWGLRGNSDTARPSLTLLPRHQATGSRWRDERGPLGACGQRGEGQAETQPGKRSVSFVLSGGRLRAKLPVEGSRLRHPVAQTPPPPTLFSLASSLSPTSNLSDCCGVTS